MVVICCHQLVAKKKKSSREKLTFLPLIDSPFNYCTSDILAIEVDKMCFGPREVIWKLYGSYMLPSIGSKKKKKKIVKRKTNIFATD